MNDRYILAADGKTPVRSTLDEWMEWYGKDDARRLGYDEVSGATVSTVFLGLDHRFGRGGVPILWETMIFGGEHDQYQERYTSYEDAIAGHARAIQRVRDTQPTESSEASEVTP